MHSFWLVNWSLNCSLIGWLIGRLTGWLIGRLIGWFIGWFVVPANEATRTRSAGEDGGRLSEEERNFRIRSPKVSSHSPGSNH